MSRNSRNPRKQREHKINSEVRFKQIRLVGDNVDGGLMSSYDASKLADDMNLDLVCINEKAEAPICKIMDYSKFIYEKEKNTVKQKALPLKEIKFGPNIGDNDLNVKVKQIIKFLDKGHKVKTVLQFRGRQMAHQELGMKVLLTVATMVEAHGVPESVPEKVVGRTLTMFLKPKK
jgi:translation initiation factor IF-3